MGIFGWSYPPGCSGVPGDEPLPPQCEECDQDDCLYGNKDGWMSCPKFAITKCQQCGKEMEPTILKDFPKEWVVNGIYEPIYTCGPKCAQAAKDITDKAAADMCDTS